MSLHSEPHERPPVVLEVPNFGYGPASAALTLAGPVADRYTWHIVSSGGAAEFTTRQLPDATLYDLDTNFQTKWPSFADVIAPGSLVVSFTNPEFAAWAIQRGYRVGVVDTLDWMWGGLPKTLPGAEFYMVQEYFASSPDHSGGQRDVVRPLVDLALWGSKDKVHARSATAVIGFGGMHVPYGNDMDSVAEYVRWFLGAVLPILIEQAKVAQLSIVGGRADLRTLIPGSWARHPAVRVHAGLDRAAYATLVRSSQHVFVSPGLAQVYECALAGLVPFIQPGFGMSMVLQAHHLALTGYPYIHTWPWLPKEAATIAGMSERDGMRYVDERMITTIRDDPRGQELAKTVNSYLDRGPESTLRIPMNPALPDAAGLFAAYLDQLTRA